MDQEKFDFNRFKIKIMAKYLTVDLRDEKNILSHLFLSCLTEEVIQKIKKSREGKSIKELEKEKIDIKVSIEGITIDPKLFFDIFEEQFDDIVKRMATKMIKEQVSDKFREICSKLCDFEDITNAWANDINWTIIDNPFQKEKDESKKQSWNKEDFKEEMKKNYIEQSKVGLGASGDSWRDDSLSNSFEEWFEKKYK